MIIIYEAKTISRYSLFAIFFFFIGCMWAGENQRVNNSFGYWADSSFHYNILDYQGNIRVVIDEDGTLEEVNNYYPYGGLMGAGAMGVQPRKYGAKELDCENGLNLYDSHARWYDFATGTTTTQDPLAEIFWKLSS